MKKILLIEDNSDLCKIKEKELSENLPYSFLIARDFTQMKEMIEANEDDIFIALLDYHLKGAEDGEAVDYLRSRSIPTIVYVDEYCSDLRDQLLTKGVLEYLLKKKNGDLLYSTRLIDRVYKNRFIKAVVVDGSQMFRDELSANLEHFGLVSLQASDAYATMDLLEKHPETKIVLIDEDFKGRIQGTDLVEDIRMKYPSDQLVILGMSPHGYNSPHSIEFLKKGANDFIIKPFIKEQLNLRIMQVLEMLDSIEEKRKLASTDFLTKLDNRRSLDTVVPAMIKYAKEMKRSLAVAMIDIDHFKSVNDTHGHGIGDEVLKHISKLLKDSFRKDDLVVRNGGEEFCVILDNIDKETSIKVFEEFRDKIEKTPFTGEGLTLDITVSIGLFYGLQESIDDMLNHADELLYRAKHEGRNRLVSD